MINVDLCFSNINDILSLAGPVSPKADYNDAENNSISIQVRENNDKVFDKYCIQYNTDSCNLYRNKSETILTINELTAGTNYTFHVFTVFQDVLSKGYASISSFTSK